MAAIKRCTSVVLMAPIVDTRNKTLANAACPA